MNAARWRRWCLGITVPALLAVAAFQIATRLVPLPEELSRPLRGTTTLVDAHGRRIATLASREARAQEPVALAAMGRWLPAATVALEDHRFHSHHGIDWRASAAAFTRNLRARRIVSGGSTITQQLIKLASHRTGRSWREKFYENLAAVRLERQWSKERILEEYLNRTHYGNRQLGPVAAARAYFHKAPANLTLPEALYLAGLPQAPTRFNPRRAPTAAAAKYRRSVTRLDALGMLTGAQVERMQSPPRLTPVSAPERLAPHFVETLAQSRAQLPAGIVETTLDLDLQRRAERALESHLATLTHKHVQQGAIVILDARTGAIRAMVGSRGYDTPPDGEINGATYHRSSGSTLKPFLYLQALDARVLTAATLLPDTPDAVRAEYIDYDPANYDKRFWGPVRVREALANSLNVPAVVTLSRLGARKAFLGLEECGLKFARTFEEYGAGLILGNAEVRLLDLTAAFTVFAGHGLAVEPRFRTSAPVRHRYLAGPGAVAIVADILSDNRARQKAFGAFSPLAFPDHRIPCKTGTSSSFRDAWTVGTTREHTVGVWVGNFDGQPMDEIAAVSGAAPLWRLLVDRLLRDGDHSVPAPEDGVALLAREVCDRTGLLPTADSPGMVREWFLPGTEPQKDAREFFAPRGDSTRLVLPPEYALWCRSPQNYLGAEVRTDAALRIVSPRPNATFLLDPHLPLAQQAVRLVATASVADDLHWTVNGRALPPVEGPLFWPLAKGRHIIEVSTASETARAEFTVE